MVIGAGKPGASNDSVSVPSAMIDCDRGRLPRRGGLVARDDLVDGQRPRAPTTCTSWRSDSAALRAVADRPVAGAASDARQLGRPALAADGRVSPGSVPDHMRLATASSSSRIARGERWTATDVSRHCSMPAWRQWSRIARPPRSPRRTPTIARQQATGQRAGSARQARCGVESGDRVARSARSGSVLSANANCVVRLIAGGCARTDQSTMRSAHAAARPR